MVKKLRIPFYIFILFILPATAFSQANYNKEVKDAATALYATLSKTQLQTAALSFTDTARLQWNNLPVGLRARAGTSIGNMSDEQRKLLHRILSVSLSSQGYLKATSIMHLDDLLNRYYDSLYYKKEINDRTYDMMRSLKWSHRNFYFAFFGEPTSNRWGYKLEGHHLSINFTFVNDKLSVTPFFIGTDPAEYPIGEYAGWRVLGQEEDLGIKLVNMLTPAQQQKATATTDVPKDIITSAESGKRLIDYWGLKGSNLTSDQQAILKYIIREFVFNLEWDKAAAEFAKIEKAGIGNIYFGWIGAYNEQKPHYYILNGPTFIIEFDNYGFTGKGDHIHAIWREKGNEYGEDVLKKHYQLNQH